MTPITDFSQLDVVLLLPEVARIYRRSIGTVRRDLQAGKFRPAPFDKRPYRWLKSDIEKDLARRSAVQNAVPPRTPPRRRRR